MKNPDGATPAYVEGSFLTRDSFDACVEQAREFKEEVRMECGEDCQFFPEYTMVCENLPKEIKDRLSAAKGSEITGLLGRIDLLVVDSNGNLRIYDYKVSRKSVGS